MEPQGDPEQRIRDLERSLTDVARTSELGTQPYTGGYPNTPPPTQQWPYSSPFPPPPQPPARRRGLWIVIAVFAVGALVLAGGVAVYLMSGSGPATISGRPTTSNGAKTLTRTPSAMPTSPATTAPTETQVPTETPTVSTAPPGGTVNISGISENRTIACNDGSVIVSGVSNQVVITGHCVSLSVSGIENVVTVDSADSIGASGFDNRVTYHSGAPEISNSGSSNVVQQG